LIEAQRYLVEVGLRVAGQAGFLSHNGVTGPMR
jgi:hypothetical protein